MKKTFNALAFIALFAIAIGAVTMGSVLADTNTTMNSTRTNTTRSADMALHQPTMIEGGHQVFYVVIDDNGDVRPATPAERKAIDVAIADGSIARINFERNLARYS